MPRGVALALSVLTAALTAQASLALPGPEGALTQLPDAAACIAETGVGDSEVGGDPECTPGHALAGAADIVLTSDGRNAYVAGAALAVFVRDPAAGGLIQAAGCVANDVHAGGGNIAAVAGCVPGQGLGGSLGLALSPDDAHLYTASVDSDAVGVFRRDPTSGALTQLSRTAACISNDIVPGVVDVPADRQCAIGQALADPAGIAVSPDGRHVYVAAAGSDAITAFSRDAETGALTQLAGLAGCTANDTDGGVADVPASAECAVGQGLDGAAGVALSPDGISLYVASEDSHSVAVFWRNSLTGALTQLSGPAGCVSNDVGLGTAALAADPQCAPGQGLASAADVIVAPDGAHVYVAARSGAVAAFARNSVTGALRQLPGFAGCIADDTDGGPADAPADVECAPGQALAGASGLAVSGAGDTLYVAALGSRAIATLRRDRTTGALTQVGDRSACNADDVDGGAADRPADVECNASQGLARPTSIAVSSDGLFVYATSGSDVGIVAAFAAQKAPRCTPTTVEVRRNHGAVVRLRCSDANREPLALSIRGNPASGDLEPIDQASSTIVYRPFPGYVGSDRFVFAASDGSLLAQPVMVSITVTPPPDHVGPKVRVGARVAVRRGGRASLRLRCPAKEPGACTGTLKLVSAKRLDVGRLLRRSVAARRVVHFGTIRFSVEPARTKVLRLRLGKRKRALVKRARKLPALVIVRAFDTAGNERKTLRKVVVAKQRRN